MSVCTTERGEEKEGLLGLHYQCNSVEATSWRRKKGTRFEVARFVISYQIKFKELFLQQEKKNSFEHPDTSGIYIW